MPVAADSELRLEPSLEGARELAREGNVVPVRARFVDDCETPVSAFLKLRAGEPEGAPCFLLESAEQGQVGRYSFVGLRPRSVLRWSDGDALGMERGGGRRRARARATASRRPDPYAAVAARLDDFRPAPVEGLPPFAGGAVGFFGYDLVRTVEPLGEPNPDPLGLPDMALMVTDAMVVFDHLRHELTILACAFADDEGGIDAAYERAAATIAEMRERLRGAVPAPARPSVTEPPEFVSNMERGEFEAAVERIVEYVHAGDAFQVVPSQRFSAPRPGRGLLGLPRPARGQPLALHVLPRVRRLPDRRRLAGAAGQGHAATGWRRGRSPAPRRAGAARTRTAASPSG